MEQKELEALCQQFSRPVILLAGDRICTVNEAFRLQLPGISAEEVLRRHPAALVFNGQRWTRTILPLGEWQIVHLAPADASQTVPSGLLGLVSQAMRQPLSGFFIVAQRLFQQLEEQESPRIQQQTAMMNRSYYQILRLAGNLSDIANYLSGTMVIRRRHVDAGEWLNQLGEALKGYCELLQVTLKLEAPKEECWVWFDPDQVERAVLNLMANALRGMDPGGRITLSVALKGSQLALRMVDSDSKQDLEILETDDWIPLQRSSPLPDPRWGVALGLRLVREVAKAHGGSVVVERQKRGGSSVTLLLEEVTTWPKGDGSLRSPVMDYAGGHNHLLVELADVLPLSAFDSSGAN